MGYKKKSPSFGKSYGGSGRSGYLSNRDPLASYRQSSPPPDEYSRKLRMRLERPDFSSSGNFSFNTNHYRTDLKIPTESKLSQREVDDLSDRFLKNAIEEFKRINDSSEMPEEKYEVARETANEIADRFISAKNNPDDETTVVDFVEDLFESPWTNSDILERVDEIREETKKMKSDALEIRDSLPDFENFVEGMNKSNNLNHVAANEISPDLDMSDYELLDQIRKKRNDFGYESEFDSM